MIKESKQQYLNIFKPLDWTCILHSFLKKALGMDSNKPGFNQLSVKLKYFKEGHTYTNCFDSSVPASL